MTVEQEMRPLAAGAGDDHRVFRGVADGGVEPDGGEVGGGPFGGLSALGGVGRVGRYAFDSQKFEKPGLGVLRAGVEAVENGVNVGHIWPAPLCGDGAASSAPVVLSSAGKRAAGVTVGLQSAGRRLIACF